MILQFVSVIRASEPLELKDLHGIAFFHKAVPKKTIKHVL